MICLGDAQRLLGAACVLAGAEIAVVGRSGDNGWTREVARFPDAVRPSTEGGGLGRGAPYGRWRLDEPRGELAWSRASVLLRSIDGPVQLTLYGGPRSQPSSEGVLRLVSTQLEHALQDPLTLAALRGETQGERADVLATLPHAVIVGQSVQLNEAALELLRHTLGNLAGRSVQRLQRALVHAAGCAGGSGVPFVGDLRVDFLRTDEGMLALFRRAHVPTLAGRWKAPAEKMLSPRQQQVAQLVMQGKNLAGIAEALEVQAETARGYLKDVYRRLGVRDRGSLTAILRF